MAGAIGGRDVWAALSGPAYRAIRLGGEGGDGPLLDATPMAAGRERLLLVRVRPVTWDAAARTASVAEEIALDVSWDRAAEPSGEGLPRVGLAPDRALGPRYAPLPRGGAASPALRGDRRGALRAPGTATAGGPMRVDPSRPWLRIGVVRGGLYRVTPADLSVAGFSAGGVDPTTFRPF